MTIEQPSILVRISPELVAQLEQQGWEFGQPDADGFHTPTVHAHAGADLYCPCGGTCHHSKHPCGFSCLYGEGQRDVAPTTVGGTSDG